MNGGKQARLASYCSSSRQESFFKIRRMMDQKASPFPQQQSNPIHYSGSGDAQKMFFAPHRCLW